MTKSSINLVDLDFANLQNSFKNFLKGQEQFKDYDFDGSDMAVLLELMAHNTYKNAFYTNMAISESFLDSAQKRNSLLSHAKELNYLPRSKRSAKATIDVTFQATGENQPYVIQKGAQFSTMIKSDSFVFTIPETLTVASANSTFKFRAEVFEGVFLKDTYTYREGIDNQRFTITNRNVDTNSVNVVVIEDGEEIGQTFKLTTTLLDLNHASKVFFLQTSETGYYEVYFGDGVLGYEPKKNSQIIIDYRVSRGTEGNGARSFSVDFDPTSRQELTATPVVEVIEAAANGSEEETNESIRYYAPKHFQVQERTVVDTDYAVALKTQFPEINAISVFGGEELNPPKSAKVVVSIDISNVEGLPNSKVEEYTNFLARRSPFGIKPIFVEPSFTYLQINSKVRYNINVTTNSASRIKALVTNDIVNYNLVELDDFNAQMRFSPFCTMIDDSDPSIISNQTQVRAYKKLRNPKIGQRENYTLTFGFALSKDHVGIFPHDEAGSHIVESSPFIFNGETVHVSDNGDGLLHISKILNDGTHLNIMNVGTVDYDTGTLTLIGFEPQQYVGSSIKFYVIPEDKDVAAVMNNILSIESDEIHIDVEGIK